MNVDSHMYRTHTTRYETARISDVFRDLSEDFLEEISSADARGSS
jgi:hypothetical protein